MYQPKWVHNLTDSTAEFHSFRRKASDYERLGPRIDNMPAREYEEVPTENMREISSPNTVSKGRHPYPYGEP